LRNLRLILRLHYYLGTHILGASRGGPCDSTALVTIIIWKGESASRPNFERKSIIYYVNNFNSLTACYLYLVRLKEQLFSVVVQIFYGKDGSVP